MYLFIDESGVHKSKDNSSVAIVYIELENIDDINNSIKRAEGKLHISTFHWTKHIWKIRSDFMTSLINKEYNVKVAIVTNPFNKQKFLSALEGLIIERKIKAIIIDGKKPKWYGLQIKKVLRDKGISVKKIITGNDESYPCLRLADAYAGLIRTYFDDKNNKEAVKLYKIVSNKITTHLVSGQMIR